MGAGDPASGELLYITDTDQVYIGDGTTAGGVLISGGGAGDVVGPASAGNTRIAAFDGTSGKLLQDSGSTMTDISSNTTHRGLSSNPHTTTFTQAVTADGGTDISAAEAEELTDGSETTLHSHAGGAGTGDVVGPASASDGYIAAFDGTTGKLIQNTAVTPADVSSNTTHRGLTNNPHSVDETDTLPTQATHSGKFLTTNGTVSSWDTPAGSGDVVGPASATDDYIAVFDGTSGKLIKNGLLPVHAELHTIQSHNDTFATGPELDELTGAGETTLHSHPGGGGGDTVAADNESITGLWNFINSGVGGLTDYDATYGDVATPDYGILRIGNSVWGRTSRTTGYNMNGATFVQNVGGPVTGDIEFAVIDSAGLMRFALPKSGVGNATYNPRSMLIAGPAIEDSDIVTVSHWQGEGIFHNLVCDTGTDGADLGVQNDLEVEGDIFTDSILESTAGAGVTIEGSELIDGAIQFDLAADPPHSEGQLHWDSDNGTLELDMPGGVVSLQIGQEHIVRVRNTTGVQIDNGAAVYLDGAVGNFPLIKLSKADDKSTAILYGLATEDIAHNSNGYITTRGLVRDVNTAAFSVGDTMFLSDSVAGGFSTTPAAAPGYKARVGYCIVSHASVGVVLADPAVVNTLVSLSDVGGTDPDATNIHLEWDNANEYWFATDGVVKGPASAISGRLASFDGTTGKLVADSGQTATDIGSNTTHRTLTNNPHSVDAADVGLENLTNVAQMEDGSNGITGSSAAQALTPANTSKIWIETAVGAPKWANLSDIPIPDLTQTALDLKVTQDASGNVEHTGNVTFDARVNVSGTGAQTVDFTNGNKAQLTQTGAVTLTLTYPGIGNYTLVVLGSAHTLTWPAALKFPGGTAPDVTNDCLLGIYYDGTSSWATFSEDMS